MSAQTNPNYRNHNKPNHNKPNHHNPNQTNLIPKKDNLCQCYSLLGSKDSRKWRHHNPEQDVLGSVFDDFGYHIYEDAQGKKHKFYAHQHLGLIHSFSHSITSETIPETWKCIKFEKDNSVIPILEEQLS